jgi:hypothetical protein
MAATVTQLHDRARTRRAPASPDPLYEGMALALLLRDWTPGRVRSSFRGEGTDALACAMESFPPDRLSRACSAAPPSPRP